MNCLRRSRFHEFVDGAKPDAREQEHLRSCASCRDRIRMLSRVEAFLKGASGPPPEAGGDALWKRVVAAVEGEAELRGGAELPAAGPGTDARIPPRGRGFALRAAAACAALLCLAAVLHDAGEPGGGFRAGGDSGPRAAGAEWVEAMNGLRHADPGPDPFACDRIYLELAVPESMDVLSAGRFGGGEEADLARLWRHRILSGRRTSADDVIRWLATVRSRNVWDHGFLSLARLVGTRGRSVLESMARERSAAPGILREALVISGAPAAAQRVFDLCVAEGRSVGFALREVAKLPGSQGDRFFASLFIAGEDDPLLVRELARRPAALRILRERYGACKFETRLRILDALGVAGSRDAFELLVRALRKSEEARGAAMALARIGLQGCREAVLALVQALPAGGDGESPLADPAVQQIGPAMELLGGYGQAVVLEAIAVERSAFERRRLWLALGLGGASPQAGLWIGAAGREDSKGLLLAFALAPSMDALPFIEGFLQSADRDLRRAALRALVALDAPEALPHLLDALDRGSDRRDLIRDMAAKGDWARPLMEAGLGYRDVHPVCRQWLAANPPPERAAPRDQALRGGPGGVHAAASLR